MKDFFRKRDPRTFQSGDSKFTKWHSYTVNVNDIKYEFDKLTFYESSQITKEVYLSISDSCNNDTFDTLTLVGNFLSYQLIKDTIIDFLNPVYDKSTSSVTFSDDSLNTGLTQAYKYELIMKMIEFELIKNNNERYVDFYNFDNNYINRKNYSDMIIEVKKIINIVIKNHRRTEIPYQLTDDYAL